MTAGDLALVAANPGTWGNKLRAKITHPEDTQNAEAFAKRLKARGIPVEADDLFNLTVEETESGASETHLNLTVAKDGGPQRIDRVLDAISELVRVKRDGKGNPILPAARPADGSSGAGENGNDGDRLDPADYAGKKEGNTGFHALDNVNIFNLMCIPPDVRGGTVETTVWEAAAEFCHEQRAFLLVDPPAEWDADPDDATQVFKARQTSDPLLSPDFARNAALYFPRLVERDPLRDGQLDTFVPCGAMAGIMARTDIERGVWKAPAGTNATIHGVERLPVRLTDAENGVLNPIAVNCLRTFDRIGHVVWEARTLRGSDRLADDYKYVPVRRLALYIEVSLHRGTQWAVFEPNGSKLWEQIRLNVDAFMQGLYRQGALQGSKSSDAYFVKCDAETVTAQDIADGIVNFLVGFAPIKPAEFVIITIRHTLSSSTRDSV